MPPDARHSSKSRLVSKSRVIAGILGEIDAAGVVVLLSNGQGGEALVCQLQCEFRVPFDASEVRLKRGHVTPGHYHATAMFAGQRLEFALVVTGDGGECKFPREIAIVDLRSGRRRRFGPEVQFAEVATSSGVVMATPIDLCQDVIALRLRSPDGRLVQGDRVRLRIRGDTRSSDIYSASMVVIQSYVANDGPRVLLAPVIESKSTLPRRASRQATPAMTMSVTPLDNELGGALVVRVLEASLNGCRCQLTNGESAERRAPPWLIPGLSVRLGAEGLRATVVRRDEDSFALHLEALDDPRALQNWALTLSHFRLIRGYDHSQVDEIVRLFTETGLLKGKRRRLYGDSPAGFMPSEVATSNPLLYQRVVTSDESGRPTGHISIARMADELWYFQEGAHNGLGGESYRVLYRRVIQTCRAYHRSSRAGPRYLSGLYHANIKSAGEIGVELFADPSSRVYPMFQFSIQENATSAAGSSRIISLIELDADTRRSLLNHFDATLVEAFVGNNGQHARLNAEFASLGPDHHAHSVALADGVDIWALAYRLNTYYSFNATGVMNSIFLIAKPATSAKQLLQGLAALATVGMTSGTDDAAVIVDGAIDSKVAFLTGINNVSAFTYFIIDSNLNREFLGGEAEPDAPGPLRKSPGV